MSIPGYTIKRELGRGRSATVYLALHVESGRDVALKVLSPSLSRDPAIREQILQCGRILTTLDHPHILPVFKIVDAANQLFLVMEYVRGGDLAERIRGGYTLERSIQTIRQVAKALEYAHAHSVVHGNLKPSNVLFRDDGIPLVTDFSVMAAHVRMGDAETTDLTMTSLYYTTPEQMRQQPLDARSDLYYLGLMFYELLVGNRIDDRWAPAGSAGFADLNAAIAELPGSISFLQPVLARSLAKDPEDRFQSVGAFIHALEKTVLRPEMAKEVGDRGQVSSKRDTQSGERREGIKHHNRVKREAPQPRRESKPFLPTISKRWRWGLVATMAFFIALGGLGVPWFIGHSEKEESLTRLLSQAEQQLTASKLSQPKGDNALETYLSALDMAPQNERVRSKLDEIARELERRARVKQGEGHWEEALTLVEQGLRADPHRIGLQLLEKKFAAAIIDESHAQQIAKWLAEARAQRAALHLTVPEEANAVASYRKVLSVDPDNRQAQAGLAEVAEFIEELARSEWKKGMVARSLLRLKLGLEAFPDNIRLQALRAEILSEQR
jgi:serine/threonine-protein kinase PpkA